MTLLPRSLFSRLVLVLLAGLVTAQLVSFAIHMHERGELLLEASGMQSAQRIADIVRLLESLGPAERRRIAGILSAPPMTVKLDQGPLMPGAEEGNRTARAVLFGAFLRRSLGDEWPLEVAVADSGSSTREAMRGPAGPHMGGGPGGGWMPFHPAMQIFSQPALSFVAQVRLHDGTLVTFDSRQPAETEDWPYRLLLSLAVLLAAVIGVSLIAVRWATRPLAALADAAEELGKNINRPPLAETGPIEVVRAARAFNTMQARLIRYLRDRTQVLAAMSHDLKTPITRLRLRAELLDDPSLRAKFTGDLGEMESMVGATLDFMRGLESDEPARPVDIMALLESLQADLVETGGRVTIAGAPLKPYPGRPRALRRCLMNLLENAIKYGKSAVIAVDDNDDRLEIRIRDEGPGIPEPELERVFEPYYRLEGSRNRETGGTGLGLTIARSIAEAHGGRLGLRNRPEGGLEARLTLPRPPGAQLKA
ncbi:MAG: ATP-binding protein [Burkholderiales bacterium]